MQTLIYKTELVVECAPTWLTPDGSLELRLQADGAVAAYACPPWRWLSLFVGARPVRIGVLNEGAGAFLRPALEVGTHLRVRIVELQPSHLASDRRARISVSVWGPMAKMTSLKPKPITRSAF